MNPLSDMFTWTEDKQNWNLKDLRHSQKAVLLCDSTSGGSVLTPPTLHF